MDIFVYYRVHPEHTELLKSAIFNMQNQLKTHYAIQTSLKRRSDQADKKDYATWMETYQNVTVEFIESLHEAVSKANISAYIEGERHVEVFEDF
jgi:hypothetical protein